MVIISMTMTLKILFISKLWLSVIDINNIQRVKKKDKELMSIAWHATRVSD